MITKRRRRFGALGFELANSQRKSPLPAICRRLMPLIRFSPCRNHKKNGPEGPLETMQTMRYLRAGSLIAAMASSAMDTMMPNWLKNISPFPTT